MKPIFILSLIFLAACSADIDSASIFSERCVISQEIECIDYRIEGNELVLQLQTNMDWEFLRANVTSFGSERERLDKSCEFEEETPNLLRCVFEEELEQNKSIALRVNIEAINNNNSRNLEGDLFVRIR